MPDGMTRNCVRCGGPGPEGGVHVGRDFICWDCERPGEDLLDLAEEGQQTSPR